METRMSPDDAATARTPSTATAADPVNDSGSGLRRLAGMLIVLGLAVETVTLFWEHPTSFLLFALGGASLVAAGILLYLWSLVRS